ncbi:dTDP-4-dehydrorhamnose reductase [Rhizobium sp. S96]|uniref:dTDP-4-dehydrorhamnose reductase n=1 Tax=Rhizobium sp. S96 TaxID=3055140 RepID=UPI0025AB3C4B|nr:dTDP-4-dehydrorhamnose reductase [Rhizobium sp. S96]MDM9620293.1 dTDP-4-dehydrorhamnose reductase [Rhizobium sp. S96]
MRLLLLGKNGQVGLALQQSLQPLGEVIACGRGSVDIGAIDSLAGQLDRLNPDVIVNAAAYTQVDLAETEVDAAFRVNEAAVKVMADYARDHGALLVHYSTDYVFDGQKNGPYVETDETHPLNVYGRSKRAGEAAIEASGCRRLVFRTSWVFSADGTNFIKTMLRLAAERSSLRVVADQFGAPTAAELIADVTALSIAGHAKGDLASGIYHLTSSGKTSWYELARYVVRRAGDLGFLLKAGPGDIEPVTTEEFPRPATRPKNSCLDTGALRSALGISLPDWTLHVDRILDQLRKRELQA